MSYYFHPAAEAEHLETVAYYESKRAGLGASYLADFEQLLNEIVRNPQRSPIEQQPEIRRRRMDKFPFTILYREASKQVQVLAVSHHRRRPNYWLGRV